jgi:G:T/U-mismatch repair DNA glycosylase
MVTIEHKFITHKINLDTEILIIGTFNPNTEKNPADFFYGRNRNYLWRLLPKAFNEQDLKEKSKQEKLDFIKKAKVDFIDIISEVNIDEEEATNYADNYLDNKVSKWRDVIEEITQLNNLKKVCFTRKSFADIPNMKLQIEQIQSYCNSKNIVFQYLTTPARFYKDNKQEEWTNFFTL